MRIIKIAALYMVAALVFIYSWLTEQRHAIYMAYLDSFAQAHEDACRIWNGHPTSWSRRHDRRV
jgi:hypothetical protein